MKISSISKALLLGTTVLGLATMAQASLTTSFIWSGNGDWSLDAVGSNNTPVGNVRAFVPVGSTVVAAFLYSSTYSAANPNVTLGSTTYSGAAWTDLGANSYLKAYRADVTSQMQAAIGGGSASMFNFSVTENTNNGGTDGEVLAIVFKNAADSFHTIAFQDGFSASGGDATSLTYANPLSGVGSAGFSAQMSLGIGFGYQNGSAQYSTVDVNGRRLTSSAGGNDDGIYGNGGLITVGGIGDSSLNPNNPALTGGSTGDTTRYDDELYDLGQGNGASVLPFVANGDTSTLIRTTNPSGDDNIFFLGVNITADATVNNHHSAPDSGTSVVLLGLGLMGLAAGRRFIRKA